MIEVLKRHLAVYHRWRVGPRCWHTQKFDSENDWWKVHKGRVETERPQKECDFNVNICVIPTSIHVQMLRSIGNGDEHQRFSGIGVLASRRNGIASVQLGFAIRYWLVNHDSTWKENDFGGWWKKPTNMCVCVCV